MQSQPLSGDCTESSISIKRPNCQHTGVVILTMHWACHIKILSVLSGDHSFLIKRGVLIRHAWLYNNLFYSFLEPAYHRISVSILDLYMASMYTFSVVHKGLKGGQSNISKVAMDSITPEDGRVRRQVTILLQPTDRLQTAVNQNVKCVTGLYCNIVWEYLFYFTMLYDRCQLGFLPILQLFYDHALLRFSMVLSNSLV